MFWFVLENDAVNTKVGLGVLFTLMWDLETFCRPE